PLPSARPIHTTPSLYSSTSTGPPELYTLSLHDALPICPTSPSRPGRARRRRQASRRREPRRARRSPSPRASRRARQRLRRALLRSEEHTSELQSRGQLVCRLLLEKKKRTIRGSKDCVSS